MRGPRDGLHEMAALGGSLCAGTVLREEGRVLLGVDGGGDADLGKVGLDLLREVKHRRLGAGRELVQISVWKPFG